MNQANPDPVGGLSMLELFRAEAENQTAVLTNGLLELERNTATKQTFESLMRAAHSLKGAARIVNLPGAVQIAHALEDCFMAARQEQFQITHPEVDLLLSGVDLLSQLTRGTETDLAAWTGANQHAIASFIDSVTLLRQPFVNSGRSISTRQAPPEIGQGSLPQMVPATTQEGGPTSAPPDPQTAGHELAIDKSEPGERVLRLTAGNLNRLLALAGESLVESGWLRPFAGSLHQFKRHHAQLALHLDRLRQTLGSNLADERTASLVTELTLGMSQAQQFLSERIQELDLFDRRSAHLSQRLYLEVLRTRMRPFEEGVRRFPRMVRDLARDLGKEIRFELLGENTQVDRDILERLETPLAHLLRNAVDHGCETPPERNAAGKPPCCVLRLEARHSAGVLLVSVTDDGRGVDSERLRETIVRKGLMGSARARTLSEPELMEFLLLPGFTLKEAVSELSGRGFGLDVVQNMIKTVRGGIRIMNQPGKGFRVQLQLPLTLSVLRALLVEIGGEPYAIPLNQIARVLKLPRSAVGVLEGRHTFPLGGHPVSLLAAHQVLECGEPTTPQAELPVVVLGERADRYGLIVDRFLGERELVVQPLEPRLNKVQDISAAALMENGAPVLIIDVDELLRSIERLMSGGRLTNLQLPGLQESLKRPKRILAVDDSLTVRELERKLLNTRGYLTDVAVDGQEAWAALQSSQYDLVITDVDMPKLDGIQLAGLIKKDSLLKSVPVMIVSYKDRPEDRMRGLEAGADYYLTKGSFDDDTLLHAVADLIGEPEE